MSTIARSTHPGPGGRGDLLELPGVSATPGFVEHEPTEWDSVGLDDRRGFAGAPRQGDTLMRMILALAAFMMLVAVGLAQAGTVTDPAGDTLAPGPDVVSFGARHLGDDLVLTLELSQPPLLADSGSPSALMGFVDLDLDRQGATGDVALVDFLTGGSSGLGGELFLDLSTYAAGAVDLVRSSGFAGGGGVVGRVPTTLLGSTLTVRIPHTLLGSDANLHTAAVVGDDAAITDLVPEGTFLASTGGNLSDAVLLQQDRFAVTVSWRNAANETGTGTLAVRSDDSAVFWFFTEVNWELMVKVVNGCAFNQHFWVFSAATTDVEYTLTVTDTVTGAVATYRNALGNAAAAVTDTSAFATCN